MALRLVSAVFLVTLAGAVTPRPFPHRLAEFVKDEQLVQECRSCCTEDIDDGEEITKAHTACGPRPPHAGDLAFGEPAVCACV